MEYMRGRKILEVNPTHPIMTGIKSLLEEGDKERARDLGELMYETALITSGFSLDSPRDYASKVRGGQMQGLGWHDGRARVERCMEGGMELASYSIGEGGGPGVPTFVLIESTDAGVVAAGSGGPQHMSMIQGTRPALQGQAAVVTPLHAASSAVVY
jgi:hypothetical protein